MNFDDTECFSPVGPGQCEIRSPSEGHGHHPHKPHDVPEPGVIYLLILVAGIAWLIWMVRRKW